ncbi:PREDICTED: testis-specific Y-encoded-like protein 1 isoform X2 [Ceratotherium simum simum]|uniref:Testis-specific Y-encoded-like protein 1 isoform X2 n=1 Tax=Ceratotherium simum simum TaxID=73337 RepID=A0ABM1D2D4_CERSS|nr:PREDICTED: testis-specific Y-encoded-like protein 1 isoform X2 [Ceratotherium simum simum]
MNGQDGVERKPHAQTRSLTAPDLASGDADPALCPKLGEETEASLVTAETGEQSLEAAALPPPRLPEEWGAPQDPAGCGHAPQIRGGGDRSCVATKAGQEETAPPTDGLEAASASVATDSSRENGRQRAEPRRLGDEKALEACGAERSGSEVMAEARAEEAKTEKCPVFSGAGDEEVEERPVGGETEMVEGNRAVEEVREEAGPQPLGVDLRMNALGAIQLELDAVKARADRAFQQLEQRFGRMRRDYVARRDYIIQNIPGFWFTAFRNHPELSPLIRGQDAEMLRYLTNLEVKELRPPRTGWEFKFFFRRNAYFLNKVIVKECEVRPSGGVVSLSTPIIWHQGREPPSFYGRNPDVVRSFFTWFSDHSLPESDRIADIIKEDLWPNPLQYYLLVEGARRARHRRIREPVEIPRPFGFQSG